MSDKIQKTIFVTGGTGLIGRHLIKHFLSKNFNIICYGRSVEKIHDTFSDTVTAVTDFSCEHVDYIIHGACPTASATLKNEPVEVIGTIYSLTRNSLELAKRTGARYLFMSSMEVYDNLHGTVDETQSGTFALDNSRNSYPVAKQLAELLVNSYRNEYGVDTCIVRLAQIFGPGYSPDDNRFFVFALKQCLLGHDIVLQTDGSKWHNSCYIDDAVKLISNILLSGEHGTFNVTNEDYCMPINDLCRKIIEATGSNINIRHSISANTIFRPDSQYKISGDKVRNLFPTVQMTPLDTAIRQTYDYMKTLK